VLVTGPTGSGKTTTLYGALAELNTLERKLITVEDPVEYRLPGINQVQVNDKIELTFARVLRSALRQDPDVVLVGEMRDQDTAQIGMRAAMTGHLVLSTLHTNDAASTPIRLLDMGVPRYMVATSIQVVLAQRLVRIICASCSEEYALKPTEHAWLKAELGDAVDARRYMYGALQWHRLPRPHRRIRNAGNDGSRGRCSQPSRPGALHESGAGTNGRTDLAQACRGTGCCGKNHCGGSHAHQQSVRRLNAFLCL
jgi:type II secretory ATPase GspE/PulE/Tfp pilus assembly ATPase PilB-like protein